MSRLMGMPPKHFVHVLDMNTNITRLEVGPQSLVLKTNESLVAGPFPCVVVPPGYYCVVENPMSRYVEGEGCQLKLGQREVRFHKEPFPLYHGEVLEGAPEYGRTNGDFSKAIIHLPVVMPNCALRLMAILDFDDNGIARAAGDIWQLEGPLTYQPRAEEKIVGLIRPVIIKPQSALRLRATQDCVDSNGRSRVTGDEWLVSKIGAYLHGVFEEVVKTESAITLSDNIGLHLKATLTHVDSQGKRRLAGEMWLITRSDMESFYPDIGVEILSTVKKTVISKKQYCVILDPVGPDGKNCLGQKKLMVGNGSFFLHPAEKLENGIQTKYTLSSDAALILSARKEFTENIDSASIKRLPGDRWMIRGPMQYIPPIEVEVVERRKTIPLSKNEGVYVRNNVTGHIRSVMGLQAYMLTADEVFYVKELSDLVEKLLRQGGGAGNENIRKLAYFEQSIDPQLLNGRDKTRVVSYRCPGNTAVQVYNYQKKTTRVVFGPNLIILGPHENFNVLSLSAGKPKVANALKTFCLMLGPDFITDILEVETADHARLRIKVAFNNYFQYSENDPESKIKIFAVPDFIGYACMQIGGRIRAAVAFVSFDEFHRYSAQIIQTAVFGLDKDGKIKSEIKFDVNNLCISGIDVQSIEPVDTKMRDSLYKSVQMAIEISTSSTEAYATHEANRIEQAAKGELERQKLLNAKNMEVERTKLLQLCAITAAVESTGQATAEAQAQADRILIECQSEIEGAKLRSEAAEIEHFAQLECQNLLRHQDLDFRKRQNAIEVKKTGDLTDIEVEKFHSMVTTLGVDAIVAIAESGPANEIKMLQSLGLQSTLITDGSNPINLFNTAQGLVSDKH